jgi:hypothetical protein
VLEWLKGLELLSFFTFSFIFLFFHLQYYGHGVVSSQFLFTFFSFYSGPMFVCNIDFFTNIFNTSYSIAVQEKAVHRQMLVPTQKWQETTQVILGPRLYECQDGANFEWLKFWLSGVGGNVIEV